jgi:hypothetical protein
MAQKHHPASKFGGKITMSAQLVRPSYNQITNAVCNTGSLTERWQLQAAMVRLRASYSYNGALFCMISCAILRNQECADGGFDHSKN